MKRIRQSLAVLLAVLLSFPTQPALAAGGLLLNAPEVQSIGMEQTETDTSGREESGKEEASLEKSETENREEGNGKNPGRDSAEEEGQLSQEEKEDAPKQDASGEKGDEGKENASDKTSSDEKTDASDKTDSNGKGEDYTDKTDSNGEGGDNTGKTDSDGNGTGLAGSQNNGTAGTEGISGNEENFGDTGNSGNKGTTGDKGTSEEKEDSGDKKDSPKDNPSDKDEDQEAEDPEADEELLDDRDLDLEEDSKPDKKYKKATPSNLLEEPEEMIGFNTGSHLVFVASPEDFDNGFGDASFEEDGSYTIQIPEENPFFPYEVQFTWEEETENVWFMTPEDSVEIGDHTFYVSAYFDDTAVTQMSFEVAGDRVVVYPEEKEFTEGNGFLPLSLLPLEERSLTVDLTPYTPVELTRVSMGQIFTGGNALKSTDKVRWTYGTGNSHGASYEIIAADGILDLSRNTYSGEKSQQMEMIVGADDQLAGGNIRYKVTVNVTASRQWLTPTIYKQEETGQRTAVPIMQNSGYSDESATNRYLEFNVDSSSWNAQTDVYVALAVNDSDFSAKISSLKAYEGNYTDPQTAASSGKDITNQVFAKNMTQAGAGYQMEQWISSWITLVSYDSAGKATGCLPLTIRLERNGNTVGIDGLYEISENVRNPVYVDWNYSYATGSSATIVTYILKTGYAADREYSMRFSANKADGSTDISLITAAYAGLYKSIAEATQAGAQDIKDLLFNKDGRGGYPANYSKGVYFTIFMGADNAEKKAVYQYCIKTEEGQEIVQEPDLGSGTTVWFDGLLDKDGNVITSYEVEERNGDSYGEGNFITMLVDSTVDLTDLAPLFGTQKGISLYAAGSTSPEVSGESLHDFSKGPVQYTASAENGKNAKNYWLYIIKATEGTGGKLYINSLKDENAKTQEKNGVTYSTREMFLDGRYGYRHDILITNIGTAPIANLSAEIVSDQVKLDDYWTLKENYSLAGMGNDMSQSPENIAKLRILQKEGVESGTEISGTLTIKSGSKPLMVLTLTGIVGDPSITTKEIPQAVKYVPYGTMIQNSNKYSWNTVSYSLSGGRLPGGMMLKPNGELYGVPTETGDFTFWVTMRNSESRFPSSQRAFTLTVIENTDANVEAATDQGYELIERVPNIRMNSTEDHRMVSIGVYDEFVDIFLDGEKLVEGVDYDSESGSTRITIRSQTLKRPQTSGAHTLGIEFRTKGEEVLKRAAQNYRLIDNNSGGGSSSSTTNTANSSTGTVSQDSKKGYVNSLTGIITGTGAGYSDWQQDEKGWKLIYADGTIASGAMITLADGTVVEQILWEKINGAWYAFGVDGYLKSGWIYDYQLNGWYVVSAERGMQSGWYGDTTDKQTYYLEPSTGALASGWRNINNQWYYFNTGSSQAWEIDKETRNWRYNPRNQSKPFGAMYANENTPDGYHVKEDGTWDGKEKE